MKQFLSITLAVLMLVSVLSLAVFADSSEPLAVDVYVTIADQGTLVLTHEMITAKDENNDGAVSLDEVLFAAHEAKYTGGAAAGYASEEGQWGLSLTKLWGDTSGAFGYYVNHASAMGLSQSVGAGDVVYAFIYSDTATWSDAYSYFEVETGLDLGEDEGMKLTLLSVGFDANWNPVTTPVEGAVITVNGTPTAYKTDANGKVTVKLEESGRNVISATSDTVVLVPPVSVIQVFRVETTVEPNTESNPESNTESTPESKGGCRASAFGGCVMIAALASAVTLARPKRKENEK